METKDLAAGLAAMEEQLEGLLSEVRELKQRLGGTVPRLEPAGGQAEKRRAESRAKKKGPVTRTMRLTSATFLYRWMTEEPQRITWLYQHLLRAHWIGADTQPDDFTSLFEGKESSCRVKWLVPKTWLVYLFRLLTERHYILLPKNAGVWMVVGSHFTDTQNRTFNQLNSQRIPVKAKAVIERFANLLDPARG